MSRTQWLDISWPNKRYAEGVLSLLHVPHTIKVLMLSPKRVLIRLCGNEFANPWHVYCRLFGFINQTPHEKCQLLNIGACLLACGDFRLPKAQKMVQAAATCEPQSHKVTMASQVGTKNVRPIWLRVKNGGYPQFNLANGNMN